MKTENHEGIKSCMVLGGLIPFCNNIGSYFNLYPDPINVKSGPLEELYKTIKNQTNLAHTFENPIFSNSDASEVAIHSQRSFTLI